MSSHISEKVIKACKANNIRFICLPPNSTHLTQPLDVAFSSLKKKWRKMIGEWKATPVGKRYDNLPKTLFPARLKELVSVLNTDNLKSGFKTCGIYPLDETPVVEKLPKKCSAGGDAAVDAVIVEHLEALRGSKDTTGPSHRRRTKLNVQPGRSVHISSSDYGDSEADDLPEAALSEDSLTSDEDEDSWDQKRLRTDERGEEDQRDDGSSGSEQEQEGGSSPSGVNWSRIAQGEFVIVKLMGKKGVKLFLAQVVSTEPPSVAFLKKQTKYT